MVLASRAAGHRPSRPSDTVSGVTEDFSPPTPLEASARALGADTARYRFDYLMLPMRDGVSSLNLATSVAAVLYAIRLHRPPR